jgi:hypothetical protein
MPCSSLYYRVAQKVGPFRALLQHKGSHFFAPPCIWHSINYCAKNCVNAVCMCHGRCCMAHVRTYKTRCMWLIWPIYSAYMKHTRFPICGVYDTYTPHVCLHICGNVCSVYGAYMTHILCIYATYKVPYMWRIW